MCQDDEEQSFAEGLEGRLGCTDMPSDRGSAPMVKRDNTGLAWFITLEGRVIGDCGAFSWPDEEGELEIGYGLAEPYRNQGYATDAAAELCAWLVAEAGTARITARRGSGR